MSLILEGLVVGVIATLTMDIVGGIGRRLGVVRIQPLGRWVLYIFRGKLRHEDIAKTPPVSGESPLAPVAHYGIGVTLAIFYLLLLGWLSLGQGSLLTAVTYGLLTNVLLLFIMFPSMGFGLLGLRHSFDIFLLRRSLINHLAYGVGIWLGVIVFVALSL